MNYYKKLLAIFLLGFSLGIVASLGYYRFIDKPTQTQVSAGNLKGDARNKEEIKINKDETNFLLLGHGGGGHSGGGLADAIVFVSLNHLDKKVTAVAIPRDFSLDGANKINTVFLKSGMEAKNKVSEVVGKRIDYFLAVDFNQFIKSVEVLGDIEVDVPKTWDDFYYPVRGFELETCGFSPQEVAELSSSLSGFELEKQFKCRYEHIHFDEGINKMDGSVALKYVRSRHSDTYGGDFARGEKEIAVLTGIAKKIITTNAFENIDKLYGEMSKLIESDIDINIAKDLAKIIVNPASYTVNKIYLSEQNTLNSSKSAKGAYILIPKEGVGNYTKIRETIGL